MKWLVVTCLLVASAHAGFFSGGHQNLGRMRSYGHSSGSLNTDDLFQGGAILLVKQSPSRPSPKSHRNHVSHSNGGHGRSLTVSGPTHLVRTIHHIQRVDDGGQILSRSHGRGGHSKQQQQQSGEKIILLVKTDQGHGSGHLRGGGNIANAAYKRGHGGW